jgi:hypothetical protein
MAINGLITNKSRYLPIYGTAMIAGEKKSGYAPRVVLQGGVGAVSRHRHYAAQTN